MRRLLAVAAMVVALAAAAPAGARGADEARDLYQHGSQAYAAGRYDEAAQLFEQSFARSNDPALLFNAAQAHRLAGHKAHALALFQSYLHVMHADDPHRDEVESRVQRLEAELAQDAAATSPAATAAVTWTPTVTKAPERPLIKRPWFWATVGGVAVAVGLGVGLGVGLTRSHGPTASLGQLPLD